MCSLATGMLHGVPESQKMSEGSEGPHAGSSPWVGHFPATTRFLVTQHKTTDGVAENQAVEMRSFSKNEIQKLKGSYGQEPGTSPAACFVCLVKGQ